MELTKELSVNKKSLDGEEEDGAVRQNGIQKRKSTPRKPLISTRKVILSEPLADLLGETQLTRTDVVRRIWAYIKEHNLQNPNNGKEILSDEKLELIFGKSTDMFKMHKLLVKHMTDPDKTSDRSSPVEAISETEKLSASEQSDSEGHQNDKNVSDH